MRKLFVLLIASLTWTAAAFAQASPTYDIFSSATVLSADGAQLQTDITLFNSSAVDATLPATLSLQQLGQSVVLVSEEVAPLNASESVLVTLAFDPTALVDVQTGSAVFLELLLASDEVSARRIVEFTLPNNAFGELVIPAETTPPAPTESAPPASAVPSFSLEGVRTQLEAWLAFLPFDVDLQDPLQAGIFVAVLLAVLLLLWLFNLVLRLIFVRPPTYPSVPPPYAAVPPQHPDTLGGRRQMWQPVATHGSMFADELEGTLHARKLLTGTDGARYSGWKIVGMRASQYDQFGRVGRTQVIAPPKRLRALNAALHRAGNLSPQAATRRVRPVAHWLANQLKRKVNTKTAALPIALDLKFKGEHGEVSIQFMLYQFQQGAWVLLDQWQPDMLVMGKSIYDSYTYTLHGKAPAETVRDFRRRVRDELVMLLGEMLLCTDPAPRASTPAPATREQAPVSSAPTPTRANVWDEGGNITSGGRPVPPAAETPPKPQSLPRIDDPFGQGDTVPRE